MVRDVPNQSKQNASVTYRCRQRIAEVFQSFVDCLLNSLCESESFLGGSSSNGESLESMTRRFARIREPHRINMMKRGTILGFHELKEASGWKCWELVCRFPRYGGHSNSIEYLHIAFAVFIINLKKDVQYSCKACNRWNCEK